MNSLETNSEAAEFCKQTVLLKDRLEESFIVLGERLYKIRQTELYRTAGYENFALFLWEMKMSESAASKIIGVYEKLILGFGISPEKVVAVGGYTLAYPIALQAKDKQSAEEWLEKGTLLTRKDLEEELRDVRNQPHECRWNELHIRQCEVCGRKEKVYKE